jgi:hypothetical protein
MDSTVRSLIAQLHDSPYPYVLAVTGGGTGVASWLLSVPGGSRTVLEVIVSYSEQSLSDYLGRAPDSFCSIETARIMARRSYERARWLEPARAVAGIGCTASLRSDRPKRGEHRFHLAIQTLQKTTAYSLTLTKEAREREGEENVLDLVLLNAMAEAFGLGERVEVPLLSGEETIVDSRPREDALADFLTGRTPALCIEPDGQIRVDAPRPAVVVSGSFNPLHTGHVSLAEAASRRIGASVAFEFSLINADKGALVVEEVFRRLPQFNWRKALWLTRAPNFEAKSALFPGAVFVVGADTAARIVQTRFYDNSETKMFEALNAIRTRGCRFLVAGRVNAEGAFFGLDDLKIPDGQRDLFSAIPADEFRSDLSSTQLRTAKN